MSAADQSRELETSCSDSNPKKSQVDPVPAGNGADGPSEPDQDGIGSADQRTVHFGTEPGDIIINTSHGRFSCHKSVLEQHSLYFKAMFDSGMKESRSGEICLENMASQLFHCLLDYFYTGHLELTETNVREMTELSNHLQVRGVLDQCCDLLLDILEDDLCLSLMRLSDALMLPEVYDQSRRHALWHFPRVYQTEDFMAAPLAQIVDYLRDPHLNVDDEVEVFTAAATWLCAQEQASVSSDAADLREFFGKVVNFHRMTEEGVAKLGDLPVVGNNQALTALVASLGEESVFAGLSSKDPTRERTSPRKGHILCVGAHRCTEVECPTSCILCTPNQKIHSAPLDVLRFDPDAGGSLEQVASLSDHYPAMALDAGYRVCAIGHLVYVVGGEATMGRSGGWLTTIWCLDTLRGTWHQAGTLQQMRRHHGLCAHGSTLYLIGGIGRFRLRLETAESFDTDTKRWRPLPDMLYQETSPAVTQHRGSIYVFKNYAQYFHIASSTWTFLSLHTPVPGLPIAAHPHPSPGLNGILVSCFNSESLWLVNLDKEESELVTTFEKEGGGGVLCRGGFYHFQLHEPGTVSDMSVECYEVKDKRPGRGAVLDKAVMTSHLVTVPRFPRYAPSTTSGSR